MERTMIALWGISNQGKTTTIRLAYDDLRKEGRIIDHGSPSRNNNEVNGAIVEIDGVLTVRTGTTRVMGQVMSR